MIQISQVVARGFVSEQNATEGSSLCTTPSSLMVLDLRDVLSLLVDYSPFPLRFYIASQDGEFKAARWRDTHEMLAGISYARSCKVRLHVDSIVADPILIDPLAPTQPG